MRPASSSFFVFDASVLLISFRGNSPVRALLRLSKPQEVLHYGGRMIPTLDGPLGEAMDTNEYGSLNTVAALVDVTARRWSCPPRA
jgi:hypothetical protein